MCSIAILLNVNLANGVILYPLWRSIKMTLQLLVKNNLTRQNCLSVSNRNSSRKIRTFVRFLIWSRTMQNILLPFFLHNSFREMVYGLRNKDVPYHYSLFFQTCDARKSNFLDKGERMDQISSWHVIQCCQLLKWNWTQKLPFLKMANLKLEKFVKQSKLATLQKDDEQAFINNNYP